MNETLLTFFTVWMALVAAAIAPGPNMVAVISRGLGSGPKSALLVTFGIAVGGLIWSSSTLLGLGALFQRVPILLIILGLVGGLYLTWLGYKGLRAGLTGGASEFSPSQSKGAVSDVKHGLLVTATNPKAAMLWVSFAAYVGGKALSFAEVVLYVGVCACILFIIYGAYGLLFSTKGARKVYVSYQKATDMASGLIFCALGLALIWGSIQEGLPS